MTRLRVVGAIVVAGALWLALHLATDNDPELTAGDRFERIDAYVADQLADARIPGAAIAIVERGKVVHATGFGHDGHGNPVTADTPFPIGSNTKSVTALAVMQLAEAGLVDLDAPVQRYLPDFGVADPGASSQITVRHLLNQTSGLARADGLRAVATGTDQSVAEAVADLAAVDLNRPVGQSFEYSNLNSVVLGLLIEEVTGSSWQDHVTTSILRPLAMTSTYTDKATAEANGLTATHRMFFGYPLPTEVRHLRGLAPSGYLYSTANDMARYLTAYLNGGILDGRRVLSAEGTAQMLGPATNERTVTLQGRAFTARYGTGWFVGPFASAADARWHQGSLPQFTAWMVLLPDTDQALVVLLNAGNQFELAGANRAWSRIPEGAVELLAGRPPPGGATTPVYIVFITLVAAAVTAQAWTLACLVRALRRTLTSSLPPARSQPVWPLIWELGGAGLLLTAYTSVTGGLGWRAALQFVPDLTLAVVVVAGLTLATGAVRLAQLTARRWRPTPDRAGDPEPAAAQASSDILAASSKSSSLRPPTS